MLPESYVLRHATLEDLSQLETLIALSARELGAGDYGATQIEGALRGAFGVDTQLLRDGTYFVMEHDGRLIVRLYASQGYVAGEPIRWSLGDGLTIVFTPMTKQASSNRAERLRDL